MSVPEHIQHDEALSTVWNAMSEIAPLSLAETSWDNVGVLLQAPLPKLNKGKKVMLAIDLTTDVVEEVLKDGQVAVLIIYHPIIFRALKSLTFQDSQQRSLLRIAQSNISIYTPHTSLDACRVGINDWLLDICMPSKTQYTSVAVQASKNAPPGHERAGFGRLVHLEGERIPVVDLISAIKKNAGLKHVQFACPSSLTYDQVNIQSIAVCAGSGSSVLSGVKADIYVTGEMSHHEVLACTAKGIAVVLLNHSNSERGYLKSVLQPRLQNIISKLGKDYTIDVSSKDRDPLETW